MTRASKSLAWQRGPQAIFARIEVDVALGQGGEGPTIDPGPAGAAWSTAVRFGVERFVEAFACNRPEWKRLSVSVVGFSSMPCDTTLAAVAYVTFHAVATALGVKGDETFGFDPTTGAFSLRLPSTEGEGVAGIST